jgi:CHAT domain-containing protein
MNIGFTYQGQSNFAAAAGAFRKSLTLFEAIENKTGAADAIYQLGMLFQQQHNFSVSMVYFEKSRALAEAARDNMRTARALEGVCSSNGMQMNFQQARANCEQALSLRQAHGSKQEIAASLNLLGWVHRCAGEHAKALSFFEQSLKLMGETGDQRLLAQSFYEAGATNAKLGNSAAALENFQRALKFYEAAKYKQEVAKVLFDIGSIRLNQNDPAQAAQLAEQAIGLARETGAPEALWPALTLYGLAQRPLNQPAKAQRAFAEAVAVIESMRSQQAGGEHERMRYIESRLVPWHRLIEMLAQQGKLGEALNYTEQAKARGLLDVMHNGHAVYTEAMTLQEQEEEKTINASLAAINGQIFREAQRPQPDEALLAELRRRQHRLRGEREAFYTNVTMAHQELRALRGKAQPLKFEEAAQLIPNSATALLNYLVTDEQTLLFVLTKEGRSGQFNAKSYKIDCDAPEVDKRVRAFHQQIASRGMEFQTAARELYDLLLKPAAEQLRGKKSLVISPSGGLWEVPFHALQSAPNRYLIEDYSLAYTPSLSVLRETLKLRQKRARDTKNMPLMLALGDPALGKETVTRSKKILMDANLDPLPEAERQIRELRQIYGPDKGLFLTGNQAREDTFKAEASKYRLLHLATHGVLNNPSGVYSYLLLAQSGGNEEDGLLEAWELIRMNLKAEAVILSACETARGYWGAGEGLVGMAGMLFVAGCPTVVVSQWKVESASTTDLMVEFHRGLKARMQNPKVSLGAAQSLRAAALKMLRGEQYRHPFWWAGFVVIGDGF